MYAPKNDLILFAQDTCFYVELAIVLLLDIMVNV